MAGHRSPQQIPELLENVHTLDSFRRSPLFRHLDLRPEGVDDETHNEVYDKVRTELQTLFRENQEIFAFIRGNPEWEELLAEQEKP